MGRSERRIEFIEVIGSGGFGEVYLADVFGQDDFVQRVAIKVLSERLGHHSDVAGRQRDEARLLAQLNHDHIVKVFDLMEIDGRPAVMMEYVLGIDAERILREEPFPPRAALQTAAAVASALDAAFRTKGQRTGQPLRVVHRDIKPANLLVSAQGGVKVLDFGIARGEFEREGQTQSVQFGTPRFMAPEQWLLNQVSPAVDIFSLGLTLSELICRDPLPRLPLQPASFDAGVAERIQACRQPEADSEWNGQLSSILHAMLAFEPTGRPVASDLYEALLDLAESAPGESVGRFARRVVPDLVAQRRGELAALPVLSTATAAVPSLQEPTAVPIGDNTTAAAGNTSMLLGGEPAEHPTGPRTPRRRWLGWASGGMLALVAVAVFGTRNPTPGPGATDLNASLGATDMNAPGEVTEPDVPASPDDAPSEPMGSTESDSPENAEPPSPEPEPEPIEAAPNPKAAPAPTPASSAANPALPPELEATSATYPITISSRPLGATVQVDGELVGTTPLSMELPTGTHAITLHLGEAQAERQIDVAYRAANRFVWNSSEETWTVGY